MATQALTGGDGLPPFKRVLFAADNVERHAVLQGMKQTTQIPSFSVSLVLIDEAG